MKDLLAPDDTRDALRKLGGLLFGIGMLMVAMRKEGDYSDFALLLIYLIPAVFLYGEGVFTDRLTGGVRPWQAVYSVFGLIFVALALGQFVDWVGEPSGWNTFWTFGVVAGPRLLRRGGEGHPLPPARRLARVDRRLDGPLGRAARRTAIARDFGIYRGLLGILSIVLLAGALHLWRRSPTPASPGTVVNDGGDQGVWKASELITGAGITAVLACSLGISSIATFAGPARARTSRSSRPRPAGTSCCCSSRSAWSGSGR